MSEIPGQHSDALWALLERQKRHIRDMEDFLKGYSTVEGGSLLDRFHRERVQRCDTKLGKS